MVGLFVIIIISWGLLYFFERENIIVLGFTPTLKILSDFFKGLVFISVILFINIYIETLTKEIIWQKSEFDYKNLINAWVYHLKSALTEDLVFRGAILYILIKKIEARKALLISAILFGVYHWFSYGILGDRIILMAYVFVATGFTGYVWAYTFYKTKSIFMGLGFHLGYNLIMSCFFESQPYGQLVFSQQSSTSLPEIYNFLFSIFNALFPSVVTFLFVKFAIKTKVTELK